MREYTDHERSIAKMLIRFYNMQAGTAFRCGGEDKLDSNQNVVLRALDKVGGDVAALKGHIRSYLQENGTDGKFSDCFMAVKGQAEEIIVEATPAPAPVVTEQSVASSLGILEQAVASIIAKTQAEKIESEIMGSVEQKVRDFIKEVFGNNAVYFSAKEIIANGSEYVKKEVENNGNSKN